MARHTRGRRCFQTNSLENMRAMNSLLISFEMNVRSINKKNTDEDAKHPRFSGSLTLV